MPITCDSVRGFPFFFVSCPPSFLSYFSTLPYLSLIVNFPFLSLLYCHFLFLSLSFFLFFSSIIRSPARPPAILYIYILKKGLYIHSLAHSAVMEANPRSPFLIASCLSSRNILGLWVFSGLRKKEKEKEKEKEKNERLDLR